MPVTKGSSTLGNDEWLYPDQKLVSPNGKSEFCMQSDGKIVIYKDGKPIWQNTPQQRSDVKGLVMQGDGNLVLYTNDGTPIWSSDTYGKVNAVAAITNDGKLHVYEGKSVWSV